MSSSDSRPGQSSNSDTREGSRVVVRLGWMLGGPLTMLVAWFILLSSPRWTLGLSDVQFWLGAIGALTLRYINVAYLEGQTADGEPSTMADFRTYAAKLTLLALGAWSLGQAVHL